MANSERALWVYLRENMKHRGHFSRHEGLDPGTPDVSYGLRGTHGWIELKLQQEWPKRDTTVLRLHHFTQWQKQWLKKRGRIAGNCWLFIRVDRDYMLFTWQTAQEIGSMTKTGMMVSCSGRWHRSVNWTEFESILVAGC